jgi:cytochrome c553
MRGLIIRMIVCLGLAVTSTAGFAAGDNKAEACLGCHNAMVSLNGRGAGTIVSQIQAIRSGDKAHPPGLAELSDEAIAEIAAYLDGA